jgi:spore coat polysaccharide biosynthesis protein SpsF
MNIIAIIQARMGSTRLPAKVMRMLSGKTVLSHVIERCKHIPDVSKVVVATTLENSDLVIADEAVRHGASYYRGSESHVLCRYYEAAKRERADVIIRITSDCPLLDPVLVQRLIEHFKASGCDYARIGLDVFPRGLDAEIFTMEALAFAYRHAISDFDKEHVTTFIQQNPQYFKCEVYREQEDNAGYRLTLDTIEDWELIERIYRKLYQGSVFHWGEIKQLLEAEPELALLNAHVEQKHNNV